MFHNLLCLLWNSVFWCLPSGDLKNGTPQQLKAGTLGQKHSTMDTLGQIDTY